MDCGEAIEFSLSVLLGGVIKHEEHWPLWLAVGEVHHQGGIFHGEHADVICIEGDVFNLGIHMGWWLLTGTIGGFAHHPKIGRAVIRSAVILVIDVFAVALTDTSGFLHLGSGGVAFSATFDLSRRSLVVAVLFGVVSFSGHVD